LRDRIAGGVLAGLVILFSIFGVLAIRTIDLSTTLALDERLRLARLTANSIDDLTEHTARQLEEAAALLAASDGPDDAASADDLFRLLGEFDRIIRIGADGHVLWTVPAEEGVVSWSLAADPDVIAALAQPTTSVVSPAEGLVGDRPVALILTPFAGAGDRTAGFLAGEIGASRASVRLLPPLDAEGSVRSQIVDAAGLIVAQSGTGDPDPQNEHAEILGPLIAAGRGGTTIHRFHDAADHVVAFYPFQHLSGGVVVEQTEDEALAIPRDMQRTLLIYGVVALLIAGGAAWLHAHTVVRPIRRLTADADRMAAGDLDKPIVVQRDDEIGELGRRFDEMRVRLKASLEESARWAEQLESRVHERTREVDERNRELDALNRTRRQLLAKTISAQEEERKRLARDLHDDSAQTLTAVLMTLKVAEDVLPPSADDGRRALSRSRAQLEMALREIRKAIADLRPSALDDLGLASAVRWYADEHLRPVGIGVSMQVVGDEGLANGAAATAIFRIVQEAVSNVARHSGARKARIRLDFGPADMVALVEDDGTGFDQDSLREPEGSGRGLGLLGMRERAELFGGTLDIEARAGGGTRIRARVPYA
jgi:signal transduction histidine kinase